MMKILVVDDDAVSRKKLMQILRPFGECDSAPSAKGALDAVMREWEAGSPYDLLFLDIEMGSGEHDGMSVLSKIREVETQREVPVEKRLKIIMATSHSDKETVVACLREGCNDYVMKPFDPETIAKKVNRFATKS